MSYVRTDYKSKKEFTEAVGRGIKHETYNPSGMFPTPQNGTDLIEGPHYPKPHRWYCEVVVENGFVVKAGKVRLGTLTNAPTQPAIGYEFKD